MITEMIEYYELDCRTITYCILTHAHHDHCGSTKALQDLGVRINVGFEDERY